MKQFRILDPNRIWIISNSVCLCLSQITFDPVRSQSSLKGGFKVYRNKFTMKNDEYCYDVVIVIYDYFEFLCGLWFSYTEISRLMAVSRSTPY